MSGAEFVQRYAKGTGGSIHFALGATGQSNPSHARPFSTEKMRRQGQMLAAVSNLLKQRHDTAVNVIRNIR